jgi:hypothetical protein
MRHANIIKDLLGNMANGAPYRHNLPEPRPLMVLFFLLILSLDITVDDYHRL